MSYSLIQELIRTGALVLWHRYGYSGTCRDFSGLGNHGTASTGCLWQGGGIAFPTTQQITVTHAVNQQLLTGTLFASGIFDNPKTRQEFINKRQSGVSGYEFYYTTTLNFYDGVNTRTVATTLSGARSTAVTFENGGVPVGYVNGLSIGNFSGAVAMAVNTQPVYIGNFAANATWDCEMPLHNAIICNRILTATEIARLHGELVR